MVRMECAVSKGSPESPSLDESLAGVDFSVGGVLLHPETSVTSSSPLVSVDLCKSVGVKLVAAARHFGTNSPN